MHSPTSYDLILSQPDSVAIQFGDLHTDAKFAAASIDVVNGQPRVVSVLARGGTELRIGYDQNLTLPISGGAPFYFDASA